MEAKTKNVKKLWNNLRLSDSFISKC